MLQYLDNVLIPYFAATRRNLDLPDDHVGLALFDVFAAHCCDSMLKKLSSNRIH